MDDLKAMLKLLLIIGVIFGIFFCGLYIEKCEDEKIWNGGIHAECGGNWKVFSATHVRNQGTLYHYKCEKCEEIFESQYNHNRKK